jgi:hypothetical protein
MLRTFVDQVKQLVALSNRQFEAIRNEAHCKGPFRTDQRELRTGIAQSVYRLATGWTDR